MSTAIKSSAWQAFCARLRRAIKAFESERSETSSTWEFRVELTRDDLDGGWVAECLDLPGTVSQGETQDEAMRNIVDAIGEVIAVRMGDNLPELAPDASAPKVRELAISL